jgi:hypothetical protein
VISKPKGSDPGPLRKKLASISSVAGLWWRDSGFSRPAPERAIDALSRHPAVWDKFAAWRTSAEHSSWLSPRARPDDHESPRDPVDGRVYRLPVGWK